MNDFATALDGFLHGDSVRTAGWMGPDPASPAERWLRGSALGALGRYGSSLSLLTTLADERPPGAYGSLACSTLASHYRQLARHADASHWDAEALVRANGHPQALFDARLGLAADAVGVADATLAAERLAVAESAADGGWRCAVRLGWVRTELALLRGENAVEIARSGLSVARGAEAARHVAKCLLFLGVAQHAATDVATDVAADATLADATLAEAAGVASALGALPLLWVAEMMRAERTGSAVHRAAAAEAVLAIAGSLQGRDRTLWVKCPEVKALVSYAHTEGGAGKPA